MQKLITEIHLTHLRENALAFRRLTGSKLCAVVKADAYGHGAIGVTNALYGLADFFAVAILEEAIEIKTAAAGKDILVFTPPVFEDEAVVAMRNGFVMSVTDEATAMLIVAASEAYSLTARVHIKVNTGMNRYGVHGGVLGKVCGILARSRRVKVEGVFSHLYTTDEATSRRQRAEFLRAVAIVKEYFSAFITHLGATYGATLGEEFAFEAVRIGLGLYGYTPVPCRRLSLKPVMRVYATCVGARTYQSGGVGYGTSARTSGLAGKRIALLRAGYADGTGLLPYAYEELSPLNRFCMDVGFVQANAKRGEQVELFSSAEALAKAKGTIVYETLCQMGMRAERRYKE